MASLLAHAALPVMVVAAARPFEGKNRRVAIAAAVCSALPDLDMLGIPFEIRATDPQGHRGVSHSLVMAALIALFVAIVWFRSLGLYSRPWRRVAWFLFGAAASHGIVDAMTTNEVGVALFSPFDLGRHFFPVKLLPTCPVGLKEYLGFWGILTIANEVLFLLLPAGIAASFFAGRGEDRRRLVRAALLWLACAALLRVTMGEWFSPTVPRVVRALGDDGAPEDIPHDDLPGRRLVRRWDELRALGVLDRRIAPANPTWSSSFFPSWFGGEAGRWTEGTPALVWRTLVGFPAPTEAEARGWIARASAGDPSASARIATLAPTEKVDLAFGRLDFPATEEGLRLSHNGHPRYWSGRCNGIAGASMKQPEPFRVVDVIGVDGTHVPFHPNDVKALLAVAYDGPETEIVVGGLCAEIGFDVGATCSINPALLVLALANRIAVARQSFLVDALPTIAKQYYAVASARIDVRGDPRPVQGTPIDPKLAGAARSLVDVGIELVLSSTTLKYERANVKDARDPSGTRYERVGVVPVVMRYEATLALGPEGELVGGMWTGDPADGPDDVVVVGGGPKVDAEGKLVSAKHVSWPFVRELARASADGAADAPSLDLRTRCGGACP